MKAAYRLPGGDVFMDVFIRKAVLHGFEIDSPTVSALDAFLAISQSNQAPGVLRVS